MSKVNYQGREVEADSMSFTVMTQEWNNYQLHDGTNLRVHSVVTEVFKLLNEHDKEGKPVYSINTANIVVADSPETLKKTT